MAGLKAAVILLCLVTIAIPAAGFIQGGHPLFDTFLTFSKFSEPTTEAPINELADTATATGAGNDSGSATGTGTATATGTASGNTPPRTGSYLCVVSTTGSGTGTATDTSLTTVYVPAQCFTTTTVINDNVVDVVAALSHDDTDENADTLLADDAAPSHDDADDNTDEGPGTLLAHDAAPSHDDADDGSDESTDSLLVHNQLDKEHEIIHHAVTNATDINRGSRVRPPQWRKQKRRFSAQRKLLNRRIRLHKRKNKQLQKRLRNKTMMIRRLKKKRVQRKRRISLQKRPQHLRRKGVGTKRQHKRRKRIKLQNDTRQELYKYPDTQSNRPIIIDIGNQKNANAKG